MRSCVFQFQTEPHPRFASLAWEVFFEERQRGLTLQHHLPWLGRAPDTYYASLTDSSAHGQLVAGLVARLVAHTRVAAIGLVCVCADYRGQGLGTELLSQSLQALDGLGVDALTLWTGKPDLYRAHGFELCDNSQVIAIEAWPQVKRRPVIASQWPDAEATAGLPAFAKAAQHVLGRHAGVVVLTDQYGEAVARWHGPDEAVVEVLLQCMPQRWRLHTLRGDTLPSALVQVGAQVQIQPNGLQMWRSRAGQPLPAFPQLRLLDRI